MPTDPELLSAIADGDRAALATLYERHAAWLTLRLSQRCDDTGLVDETVQDTFVRVWRKAGTWRGHGEVGAWLWGIAIRRLIDGLRKPRPVPVRELDHGREATVVAAEGLIDGLRKPRPVPVRELDHGREATVVAAEDEVLRGMHDDARLGPALDRLTPELRAVMQACVLDGLTNREAGKLLGVPAGTVKSRMHRARAQLRQELA